ncbi:MAG: hypothetical protein WA945_02995 [Arcobacteraceae bacterium]
MRLILLFLLLTFSLSADDDYKKKYHHYYSKDLTYLNLTYEQKEEITDILKEYRHDIKKYKKYKKKKLEDKEDIFEEDILDIEELYKINQEISGKASQIEISFLEKIHQILSENQREKFIDYIDEWEIE